MKHICSLATQKKVCNQPHWHSALLTFASFINVEIGVFCRVSDVCSPVSSLLSVDDGSGKSKGGGGGVDKMLMYTDRHFSTAH